MNEEQTTRLREKLLIIVAKYEPRVEKIEKIVNAVNEVLGNAPVIDVDEEAEKIVENA